MIVSDRKRRSIRPQVRRSQHVNINYSIALSKGVYKTIIFNYNSRRILYPLAFTLMAQLQKIMNEFGKKLSKLEQIRQKKLNKPEKKTKKKPAGRITGVRKMPIKKITGKGKKATGQRKSPKTK